ncbi:ferrous iron transport protein A [Sphingorhabdus sp.]|uniref:ferrous iron transport protein A n=1 Tax=Sphingorhabdus sp. TaxID=1902408 RepID=UPI0037CC6157
MPVQLHRLPLNRAAVIRSINWDVLPDQEGHRLRSLGFEPGVTIEALHKGILIWRDPIAVRVGRMTVALRTNVASAIDCEFTT